MDQWFIIVGRSNFIHKLAVTFRFLLRCRQHFSMFPSHFRVVLRVVEVGQFKGYFLGLDGLLVSSIADKGSETDYDGCCEDEEDWD